MALNITVHGQGTFTASMEEGPVSFTAAIAAVGPQGATGPAGPAGTNGTNGVGVPTGGTVGQILAKTSATNYDTQWVNHNPFDQTLNQSDSVYFAEVRFTASGTDTILGNSGLEISGGITVTDTLLFPDATTQETALPNGTNDGDIVTWTAATSTWTATANAATTVITTGTNKTGATLTKGTIVYINGAQGSKFTIAKAKADADGTSAQTMGVVQSDIANNAEGNVITFGMVTELNTSAYADGTQLYLSGSTAGAWTSTKPSAPTHLVYVGVVSYSHAIHGKVLVKVQNGYELDELHDVAIASKADKDLLVYESSSGLWKNKSFSTLDLLTATTAASTYLTSATAATTYQTQSGMSSYLTTSAASSTYLTQSSAASTYQTQAGMSSYLTSATAASTYLTQSNAATTYFAKPTGTTAQYLRGDGTTSTFSTDVNSAVSSASTSTAGKVQLSTDAQAVAGTSTTLAVTPSGLAQARLNPSFIALVATDASTLTSGGTSTVSSQGIRVITGTANASYGGRVFEGASGTGAFTNVGNTTVSFSKPIWLSGKVFVATSSETANYVQRFSYGKRGSSPSGTDIGDLAVRGFGIKCNGAGNAIVLQVHNGTSLSNVTSSFTPTAGNQFDVEIYSDGSGNVTLYVNGSSVATSSAGPTGNSTAIVPTVYVEAVATGAITTTTNTGFGVSAIKLDLNSNA